MTRSTLLTLAMLVLAPLSLEAQNPATAAQRLTAARARAAQAGIPAELIDNRIAEGRAKGVSEDRIADAIERRAAGLARAQEAMVAAGIRPTSSDLSVGADALEAGVDAQALRTVIQAARAEDRPVALAVLGELVRQGVPVQEARDRVRLALERREANLVDLPRRAAAERIAAARAEAARAAAARGEPVRPAAERGRATGANGTPATRPPGVPATERPAGGTTTTGTRGGTTTTPTPGTRGR